MKYFSPFLLGICLLYIFLSNQPLYGKGDHMTDFKKWGFKSVELKEVLELKEEPYIKEILYSCQKTSSKFDIRLYYEHVEFKDSLTVKDNADEKILTSLVGFSFEMYDLKTNRKISSYKFKNASFRDNNEFVYNQPLSIWIASQITVKKNQKYKIILYIPSKNDTDVKFLKPVLIGGVAADIFL